MVADGKAFRANVTRWAEKFNVDLLALARQTAQEAAEQVHYYTPIDLGFLRGSWQPSLNTPKTDEGNGAGIATLSAVLTGIKLGDVFWMTNNAAYALRIEFGFVGPDKLGRVYNQAGQFYVTKVMKRWGTIVESQARALATGSGKSGGSSGSGLG